MRFRDQVAVVAGASEGIGKATVLRLTSEGAKVVALARNPAKLAALREAASIPSSIVTLAGDATAPETGPLAIATAVEAFGRLDVLVNCVGGSTVIAEPNQPIERTSDEDWDRMMAFNLQPMVRFTRAAVPVMKQQRAGSIVNLSSLAGYGKTGMTTVAYAAAKGAVMAFTAKLARELAPWGITVNATAPGLTMSERIAAATARWPLAQLAAAIDRIPLGRASTVEEQAAAICFFASRDAAYVTGVTLDVTGGV
ncbi:NAD(P)-dependent dehydrogenase (short-subunit alcohol dehydrogenase family) [Variovorax boronicumulans]|uniref:SDR family NAD(P)-dependent oxidoreductase n=1 Tax=Variovorax boronicumulans TaxID=436515 RepID=UPI0027826350|nr:SDR family NAD(P)-dependent oxidoreductase [Variovorax boronicumulans]MDP9994537.1 NAD(P)-dependent dehydrogenase (short-subunit alcohol dehydrogenase family) [Variovorax boronicumulans]MDQ0005764.1 NAD(P)-dependent dehydrogenase (short-subunit alcohol dehydrogenase family) [Variovorax boronicumulans]MDQ0044398.1 NAD(P)-dependent dehydrogenase (short-subunit alcohol dehydrogenase family) [Variovorax boronicumulans]